MYVAVCWLASEEESVNYFKHTAIVQVMCLGNMAL